MSSIMDKLVTLIDEHMKQGKPMKTEGGVKYPASDYAYVPDRDKPSTWKLRLAEGRPGNVTIRQLGRAAAAFSPGGFRGRKVQIPASARGAAKRRIRSEYRKLGVDSEDIPDSVKEMDVNTLTLWKEGDRYRWLAVFSNKYRDNDSPPEILASFAHKEFVAAVDAGEWPVPELRHWHVPGTRWGMADWLAYDEDTGFTLASGWVDAGHEKEAEVAMHSDEPVKVSHGMPVKEIQRDEDDPTIIVRYRTAEISDLPAWAAANPLTDFHIIDKEVKGMSIPQEKKDYLLGRGLTEQQLDEIEAALEGKAQAAGEMGLEHKETEETPPEAPETEEQEPQPAYVTREEVAQALSEATQTFAKVIQDQFKALRDEIEALKQSDEEKIAKAIRTTPAASLSAVLTDIMVKGFTGVPVGEGEEIKGPKETPHDADEGGIPILTALSKGGDWRATLGVPESEN